MKKYNYIPSYLVNVLASFKYNFLLFLITNENQQKRNFLGVLMFAKLKY